MLHNSFSENRPVYEIAWKNTVQSEVQRMCFACFIPKATNHAQNI